MSLHLEDKINIITPKDFGKSFETAFATSPYASTICFWPLINFFKEKKKFATKAQKIFIENALQTFKNTKGFACTFDKKEDLAPYKDLISLLLSGLFPLTGSEDLMTMVSGPFEHDPFYVSPKLEKIIKEGGGIKHVSSEVLHEMEMKLVWAGCQILDKFYNQNLNHFPRFFFKVRTDKNGTERYLRSHINTSFVDIKLLKPLKPLSDKDIKELLNNITDAALWKKMLPPENFEFRGFVVGQLNDITEEQSISNLKHKLLEKDALTNKNKILALEEEVSILLEENTLRLGLTALDYPEKNILHQYKIRGHFLADEHGEFMPSKFPNSIYAQSCERCEPFLISDLADLENTTILEKSLLKQGLRSLIVYPLKNEDNSILGLLEVGSPNPNAFNSFTLYKLNKVIALFNLSIERSREEIDNKIEAVIREEYTTLHESVEWKFIEQAYDLMNKREVPRAAILHAKPIKFPDVYPLYAQADIVSSSVIRNESIQADILTNLRAAKEVLVFAQESTSFPLTELHLADLNLHIEHLTERIQSSDESEIVDFLHQRIHPYFHFLEKEEKGLSESIQEYFSKLDPNFNIIYDKRKAYEESVSMLNKRISLYLEKEEKKAQAIIPHYYEKYATDGVEFEMYAGQSITHKKDFTQTHLGNLRLWQFQAMCEITRGVADLRPSLPVPLTTAQMIFVYSQSISIRFLLDEKHFDVDGAYNVRYKIMKKRIDKAIVKDTGERVTLSGKIAIIYSTERDRLEYLAYIKFLQQKGLLTEEIEELEIAPLQGVDGLSALRVTVI